MQAKLQFVTEHEDKDLTSWKNVLWSDEPIFEEFGYDDCCVDKKEGLLQAEENHPN